MGANTTVNIYGTQPPRFIEHSIVLKKPAVYGLNFPLGENKTTGGFFQKKSGVALIKDAVTQLLQTERGERILLPKFGCNLRKFIFQPLDEDTFEAIREEIVFSFAEYILGARIKKLSVVPYGNAGLTGGNSLLVRLILEMIEADLTVFDVEVVIK